MAAAHGAGRRVALTLSDPFCVERHRDEFLELVDDTSTSSSPTRSEIFALYEVADLDEAVGAPCAAAARSP